MELPVPIETYFAGNSKLDPEAMLSPFAAAAVVRDERRTHQGRHAIREWIDQSSLALAAIATPNDLRSEGSEHSVTAEVAGNFPGSPVLLTFDFRLASGRIIALEIR